MNETSGSFVFAQPIIVKFLTNENMKPAEILMRLRVQFSNEMLSRTKVYDWSMSFKKGQIEVENMPRPHLLQGRLWPAFFGTFRHLIY
jgi:hypothetical protein